MGRRVLLTSLVCAWALGCNSPPPAPPSNLCIDSDKDGYDSCVDCKDDDKDVHPGAAEACNGKDDDCSGTTDDGCGCKDGDPARACGAAGGGCTQACVDGQYGACLPASGVAPELQTDPKNCGECGKVCPVPVHAPAACAAGACGRGPCEEGWFDLDGGKTAGCEVSCIGKVCEDAQGNPVKVDAAPVPETGSKFLGPHAGSSYGGAVQTTPSHTNTGFVGAGLVGASKSSNGDYQNFGGFTAAEHQ